MPLQPPAPDQFVYELSVAGRAKSIVVAEGANTPQVLRDVIARLRPGGYLVVGHSESLHGMDLGLDMQSPSIYRKPA